HRGPGGGRAPVVARCRRSECRRARLFGCRGGASDPSGGRDAGQPGEGCGGPGRPEREPDLRLARNGGADRVMVRVVKIGGRVLEDSAWLGRFADFAARSPHGLVVVHGGGPEADAYSRRLGIVPERVAGRRVTSPEVLDVLEMVLAGRLNKRLVRALASGGVDAIGLSGQDGSLLVAEGWSDPSLGRV